MPLEKANGYKLGSNFNYGIKNQEMFLNICVYTLKINKCTVKYARENLD